MKINPSKHKRKVFFPVTKNILKAVPAESISEEKETQLGSNLSAKSFEKCLKVTHFTLERG